MATATAPALVTLSSPCPAVQINFTSLPTSTSTTLITVYRVSDGITDVVRNANATEITGSTAFTVTDWEAPFGITVAYYATMNVGGVDQGAGSSTSTTLNVTSMWVSDPLNPRNSMAVAMGGYSTATLGKNTLASVKRGYVYNLSKVLGQQRPFVQYYGQKGIEGATLEVYTHDAGDTSIKALLSVSPVLIRMPAVMLNVPARMYGVIEADQQPLTVRFETVGALTLWNLTFNETAPQSTSIVFSVYSYAYWSTKYPSQTYATVLATTYGSNTYNYAIANPPA